MALPTNFSNTYEDIYDVFGGQDAVNDLITQFKSYGLDDNTIASVFAPYRPAATAATTGGLTQVANNTGNTGALKSSRYIKCWWFVNCQ